MKKRIKPSIASLPIIVGLNIFVYLLWQFWGPLNSSFMADHFLVSWSALEEGRYWTVLTSVFSHNLFFHIFINMYVLWGFGTALERALGTAVFLPFYLGAGIAGSLVHSLASAWLLGLPDMAALGASGAVAGVILVFSLMFPREKILFLGLIPLPAVWGAVFLVGLDLWGLLAQARGHGLPIGHGAHLGGAFAGLIFFLFFIKPRSFY